MRRRRNMGGGCNIAKVQIYRIRCARSSWKLQLALGRVLDIDRLAGGDPQTSKLVPNTRHEHAFGLVAARARTGSGYLKIVWPVLRAVTAPVVVLFSRAPSLACNQSLAENPLCSLFRVSLVGGWRKTSPRHSQKVRHKLQLNWHASACSYVIA
eukprot:4570270-Pleurochrysis_carterae.AAC.1